MASVGILLIYTVSCTVNDKKKTITAEQIRSSDVTGYLGVSLGKCVSIRASIEKGVAKGSSGSYLLNVTQVDERVLPSPVECKFHIHQFATEDVAIAKDSFGLHKLLTGKDTGKLMGEEIASLEKGYIGKEVTLVAYETGRFLGTPSGLSKDYSPVAGTEIPICYRTVRYASDSMMYNLGE